MDSQKESKKLVRSNAMCGDDDTRVKSPVRLVNSQTKPALSSSLLSKDSTGYTDVTGIDLHRFIRETLHKNAKDREHLIQLEDILIKFLNDHTKQAYHFPKMTSYDRMIVHRVSAFFGLDHNVTQDGQAVVVTKTDFATIPPFKFCALIEHDNFTEQSRNSRSSSLRSTQNSGSNRFVEQNSFGEINSATGSLTLDLGMGEAMRRTRSVDYPCIPNNAPYMSNVGRVPYVPNITAPILISPTQGRPRTYTISGMAPPDPSPNNGSPTSQIPLAQSMNSDNSYCQNEFSASDFYQNMHKNQPTAYVQGCLGSVMNPYPYNPYAAVAQNSFVYARPGAPTQIFTPGPQTFYAPFYS